MSRRHSVGSTYQTPGLGLPVLVAAVCLVVGAILHFCGSPTGITLFGVAGGALVVAACAGFYISSRRRFLQTGADSFTVSDRDGRRDHAFSDVRALASSVTPDFESGIQKSVTYHLRIWLDDPELARPLVLEHKAQVEGLDETETWVRALQEHLVGRARSDLGTGRPLSGEGWELRRDELRLSGKDGSQTIQVGDIQAVDVYDGNVCVWKVGQDDPVCRIPLGGVNAWMLTPLLRELAPARPAGEEPPAGSLGRVLFERGSEPKSRSLFLVPVGLMFIAGGVVLCFTGSTGWGIASGIAGAIICFGGVPPKLFRCHEWGVREVRLRGEQVLRYGDMASFSYHAVRHFLNGSYQGTDFTFIFVPRPGAGDRSISYSVRLQGFDQELEVLRDHISKVIAGHMAGALAEGRPVQWTPNLRLLPDGIEHTPSGLLGRKAPVTIPFGDIANFDFKQGVFHIWIRGQEKSVIQEDVSQPNFFPGLSLFRRILTPVEESGGGGQADAGG